ncbi:unannotated protein [freshwater metagenome]|uniref:Unannotated protein n=1 Tax=freshwater metagenome TaxID=449393 RepID=A0A6J7P625_9ZZZZ
MLRRPLSAPPRRIHFEREHGGEQHTEAVDVPSRRVGRPRARPPVRPRRFGNRAPGRGQPAGRPLRLHGRHGVGCVLHEFQLHGRPGDGRHGDAGCGRGRLAGVEQSQPRTGYSLGAHRDRHAGRWSLEARIHAAVRVQRRDGGVHQRRRRQHRPRPAGQPDRLLRRRAEPGGAGRQHVPSPRAA